MATKIRYQYKNTGRVTIVDLSKDAVPVVRNVKKMEITFMKNDLGMYTDDFDMYLEVDE